LRRSVFVQASEFTFVLEGRCRFRVLGQRTRIWQHGAHGLEADWLLIRYNADRSVLGSEYLKQAELCIVRAAEAR
jgi:hypothetical protein